jgi:1-acyl-sn-glycerol-3-phosphate acyltransferase
VPPSPTAFFLRDMPKVNPKDMKAQVYRDSRPAEMFTQYHRTARRGVGWIYDFVRMILTLPTILLYRARAIGVENVPATGPVILAPNHFSQWDHFFAAVYLQRKIQFMAKSQLFKNPAIKYIFKHGGVFPVRRGHHDEEAFVTANKILDRGGTMLMYAEGGRSRTGDLGQPKRGIGKIALESGVPVVPVAIHGSAHVRGWRRLQFPKVTIQYGEPVTFPVVAEPDRDQQQDAANQVFDRVRAMYVDLEENGRRDVLRRLREGLPAASPEPDTARRYSS